jgi:hypothetical protein
MYGYIVARFMGKKIKEDDQSEEKNDTWVGRIRESPHESRLKGIFFLLALLFSSPPFALRRIAHERPIGQIRPISFYTLAKWRGCSVRGGR